MSHSFMKIGSPNLQRMFIAMSVKNFGFALKNKMATIADCLKIIKTF